MDFNMAFDRLIGHEGAYQNDPNDSGNWTGGTVGLGECKGTKFGISAASYPNLDIEGLTVDDARGIYLRDYWRRIGCDRMPDGMRFDLFDAAVNSGRSNAVKFLQRALGVTDDGVFGPGTQAAIGAMDPERLFARFNGHRLDFINDNPKLWVLYGRGWTQRIAENLKAA